MNLTGRREFLTGLNLLLEFSIAC